MISVQPFEHSSSPSLAWTEFWDTLARAVGHVTQSESDGRDEVGSGQSGVIKIATHEDHHRAVLQQLQGYGSLSRPEHQYLMELFEWSDPRLQQVLGYFDRTNNMNLLLVRVVLTVLHALTAIAGHDDDCDATGVM